MNEQNRPTLNYLDERIQPQSPWAMVALAPVVIPAGFVAGLGDVLFVYPATQIGPSASRVGEVYFGPSESGWFVRSMTLVPRALLASADFALLWSVKSFFIIPGEDEGEEAIYAVF